MGPGWKKWKQGSCSNIANTESFAFIDQDFRKAHIQRKEGLPQAKWRKNGHDLYCLDEIHFYLEFEYFPSE